MLRDRRVLVDTVIDLSDSFKDGYAADFLPWMRSGKNWLASMDIGDQDSRDAYSWWSDWNLFYTLPERNDKFGATLTRNEQRAWKGANITPEDGPEEIRRKMDVVLGIMKDKHMIDAEMFKDSNLPDSAYESIFGGLEHVGGGGAGGAGVAGVSTSGAKPAYEFEQDEAGNFIVK